MLNIIKKLIEVSPRYGHNEIKAAKVIVDELKRLKVSFVEEVFDTSVPVIIKSELFADGEEIECMGSSFSSGKIKDKKYLISSFNQSEEIQPYSIVFNPISDDISVMNVYKNPSVTISRNSVAKIALANKVEGMVEVKEEKIKSENILVGNTISPRNIIFAHYDCVVGNGAVDNAVAVSLLMELIKTKRELLTDTLLVFTGNEELSYDKNYDGSGYGFRIFEDEYNDILNKSQKIIVIDGIGVSKPSLTKNNLDLVLQLKGIEKLKEKTFWLQNDQNEVLKNYHSKSDVIKNINKKYLKESLLFLIKNLCN